MAVNFFSDTIFNCDNFSITSASTSKPEVFITTTGNNNKPSILYFTKDKGAAGADADGIGAFSFVSDNDAQQQTTFGSILYSVESATDGQEEGKINIGVAALNSGGNNSANVLEGVGNGQNVTDVTIGLGATNVTTIAGTLTMGSTATLDNSGNLLTNAATATALTSGNKTISGDLTTNNVFLPGGGTISFDDSLDGSDQFITGTDSNLTIDGDDKIKLRADTQIEVKSTSNTDTVIITNNSGDIFTAGDIELGHASDTTIARSAAGTVTIEGNKVVTENKQLHVIPSNFFDDIGTIKHYVPLSSQSTSEQTGDGNTVTDFLCPCSTKVKEVMVKLPSNTTGSGDLTVGIETVIIGTVPSSKSIIETETVTVASSNDNDIVHFIFDDTTHATIGQNLSISIQSDTDLSGSSNWYVVTILEFDWSTRHTSSSAVQTS